MSLELHADRLEDVGGLDRVYKIGKVPKKPKTPYCVVSLDAGTASTYSLDSRSDTMRLLNVQHFAETSESIEFLCERSDLAFRDQPLDYLPGSPMCNRIRGTNVVRDDPEGESLLYVLHVYQYQEDR